jgi:hypothetical protein
MSAASARRVSRALDGAATPADGADRGDEHVLREAAASAIAVGRARGR